MRKVNVDLAEMVGLVDRGEGKRRVEGVVRGGVFGTTMVEKRMDGFFFGMVQGLAEWA